METLSLLTLDGDMLRTRDFTLLRKHSSSMDPCPVSFLGQQPRDRTGKKRRRASLGGVSKTGIWTEQLEMLTLISRVSKYTGHIFESFTVVSTSGMCLVGRYVRALM
jgi:hypothetical protein